METTNFEMNPFTLAFQSSVVEGEFLGEVANRRWPVLIFIFCFDIFCFLLRFFAKLSTNNEECLATGSGVRSFEIAQEMGHQLANMAMLYMVIGLLNRRARKSGSNAARQEEVLLSICMGLAICNLLASLRADNAQDYVYMGYFLICTSTFLKIRWWVGTGLLATPTIAVQLWYSSPAASAILPPDAVVHIVVAWAVGGLMAYLSDWYRRQMYAHARLAAAAHEKEMMEATARIQAQRELATAQAQVAQRALIVAREKAAHEAKNEFMSLMCHEVRTPLNGCLASAEMLLETPLKEEQRELANTIRVSGSILLSTVSNFLDFFKLEAGKRLDIVRSEVTVADLVGDVHCIIEAMIGRGGSVSLQPPQLLGVPEVVYCDPDRLRGILLNLYTNAAKFTKRGHILLRAQSVAGDYIPPAPAGRNSIILQPSYRPSSSSHRSMDISSSIVVAPAVEEPFCEEPDTWKDNTAPSSVASHVQSQPLLSEAHSAAAVKEAEQPDVAGPTTLAKQRQQQSDQFKQEFQPFWQQASTWARGLLHSNSSQALNSLADADAQPISSSNQASTSNGSPEVFSSKSNLRKATGSNGSKGHVHFDVHAMSSAGDSPSSTAATTGSSNSCQQPNTAWSSSHLPTLPAAGDEVCWLLFEVEDTGIGITRDGLASLFKEYVQGTEDEMCKPRTRGGTGLGLSICSKQIGVLDGLIGAHSCKGQGSTFWFKIPTYLRPPRSSKTSTSSQDSFSGQQQQQQLSQAAPNSSEQANPIQQQQQQPPAAVVQEQDSHTDSSLAAPQQWQVQQGAQQQQGQQQTQQLQAQYQPPLQQRPMQQDQQQGLQLRHFSHPAGVPSRPAPQITNYIQSSLYSSSQGIQSSSEATKGSGGSSSSSSAAVSADKPLQAFQPVETAASSTTFLQQDSKTDEMSPEGCSPSSSNSSSCDATSSSGSSNGGLDSSQVPAQSTLLSQPAGGQQAPLQPVHAGNDSDSRTMANAAPALSALTASATPLAAPSSVTGQGLPSTAVGSNLPRTPAAAGPSSSSGGGSSSCSSNDPSTCSTMVGSRTITSSSSAGARSRQLSIDGQRPGPALDIARLVGRRVLLAEDNLINQTVARKMLSSLGMQVQVASNGLDAVKAVQRANQCPQQQPATTEGATAAAVVHEQPQGGSSQQEFSIVLMDMSMPVMGGVEATRMLRQQRYTLPIVAMTANASEKDQDECQTAGMNGFLSKPVLRDQLARAILAALQPVDNNAAGQ